MKIHGIALRNFTCYAETMVSFDETLSVIIAENAEGKTSIVDAITYCLTGHCARTDKAGRGAEAMIRTRSTEAGIGLEIGPDALKVSRRIPGGLWIDGHEGGQRELQEFLYETIGAGDGAVTAALNTHAFLDLSTSEQKSLLFGLLGLFFDRANVIDQIMQTAVTATTLEDEAQALEKCLDAVPANLFDGTGQTWANLYKHFYELRRSFKRQLKDLGEAPQLSLVPDAPDKDHLLGEVEGLEQVLYEVRSQRDKAADECARSDRTDKEIAELQAQLETAADTKAAQKELDTVIEEFVKLEQEAMTATDKAAGLQAACEALKAAGANRECPLAPGVVTCPLTKPKRTALVNDLTTQMEKLETEAAAAQDAASLLRPRRKELGIMANAPDKATLEGQIAGLRKERSALDLPMDPATAESEVLDLQGRIAERKSALEEITKAEGAREVTGGKALERARLTDEVEVLEALVELTSPKGVPGKLLGDTIGPLQDLVNERLLQLTGGRYQLTFEIEPDFHIVVTHDGAESDLKRLSSSERMRLGIVLQDAVSRLSGLRVMVVDDADKLDPHNRVLLMDTLMAIKADFDTILVMSTVGPAGVTDPGLEDVAVYQIVEGQIARLGKKAMVR